MQTTESIDSWTLRRNVPFMATAEDLGLAQRIAAQHRETDSEAEKIVERLIEQDARRNYSTIEQMINQIQDDDVVVRLYALLIKACGR